jgi:predicted outer membrane protein
MRFRFGELMVFGVFLFAAAIAVIVVVPQGQAASQQGWTQTQFGPLGPADRDLLIKVRWAGLWEIPAGRWAQDRAGSAKVKDVGIQLMSDHTKLDAEVRAVAARLGVPLPDQPNQDQQRWLEELSNSTGAEFDQIFADRLRAAHGKVFSTVAAVRAGTRNELVRSFAEKANAAVMKHMGLLEGTGLVDYSALPTPSV